MGVKTALAAMVPNAASKTQATTLGIDIAGLQAELAIKCDEIIALLRVIGTDVTTPSGDTTAGTIVSAQITAMS